MILVTRRGDNLSLSREVQIPQIGEFEHSAGVWFGDPMGAMGQDRREAETNTDTRRLARRILKQE
jgi:hypothetical protein